MIDIEDRGPALTENQLLAFEASNGIKLPADYKTFLLTYNGGAPVPNAFPLIGHRENASDISFFMGLATP